MTEGYLQYYRVDHVNDCPLAHDIIHDLVTCTYFTDSIQYAPIDIDVLRRAQFIAYHIDWDDNIDAEFYIPPQKGDRWVVIQRYYEEQTDTNPTRDFFRYLSSPQFIRPAIRCRDCIFCGTFPTLLSLAARTAMGQDTWGLPQDCCEAVDDVMFNRIVCQDCWLKSFGIGSNR
jgi:hypothetical protein